MTAPSKALSMLSSTLDSFYRKTAALPAPAKAACAVAAGAIMVPAMPPWGLWPALFIGLSFFYILLSTTQRARSAFFYGWLFGFGYFAAGLSWIGNALLVGGSPYKIFWPLAVAALPAALAFFPAFAAALIRRFSSLSDAPGYLLFCAVLMASEWLRGHIFTGFPWNLYGYAWAQILPVAQIASLGGIYGLSLITCLWAAFPGFLLVPGEKPRIKALIAAALLLSMGGAYAYGAHRLAENAPAYHEKTIVKLVQPNTAQEDKWDPEKAADNLGTLLDLSSPRIGPASADATTLIVWPETAISDFILRNAQARAAIRATLSAYETPVFLLTGVLRFERPDKSAPRYYNSLVSYDKNMNALSVYDKFHLVPFGEYIPFQKWIPLDPVVNFSGFEKGRGPQTAKIPGLAEAFSPLVCYEIIFSGRTTEKNSRPDFIVNVTNDAWYGDSAGPRQHFAQAQFRAIEEGLPVIRAANTGISGIVDPSGRIAAKIPLGTQGNKESALPASLEKRTFYTKFGDSPFGLFLALLCLISFLNQAYKKRLASSGGTGVAFL